MSGPASSELANAEMKKYEDLRAEQVKADFKWVMEDPRGRRAVYEMIFNVAGSESLSYTGVSESTMFREGRRDVGLTLMRQLQEAVPELYLQMLSEAVLEAAEVTRRMKRITETYNGGTNDPDA